MTLYLTEIFCHSARQNSRHTFSCPYFNRRAHFCLEQDLSTNVITIPRPVSANPKITSITGSQPPLGTFYESSISCLHTALYHNHGELPLLPTNSGVRMFEPYIKTLRFHGGFIPKCIIHSFRPSTTCVRVRVAFSAHLLLFCATCSGVLNIPQDSFLTTLFEDILSYIF